MKHPCFSLLIAILLLPGVNLIAQPSELVVFTQSGSSFKLIMNGIQQSADPVTNIRITDLAAPSYKLTVRFPDPSQAEIQKTIYLSPGIASTYEVMKNRKGEWVVRLLNESETVEEPAAVPEQVVYVYSPTPRVSTTTVSQTTTVNTGVGMFGASVTTTTSQTTTTVSGEPDRFPGAGDHPGDHGRPGGPEDHPSYEGPRGCPRPMTRVDFEQVRQSVTSKKFESSKLTVAKQIVGANCLTSRQVKEIMQLFTFESDKLEFAKFAYRYTWDIRNYFLLNDAFGFESSIDELNRFIEDRK